ncbi:OLC1v1029549C1 [Oldenlandia corymbosa var. corymbosa]|uniref:Protein SGT1 homolog n=1 Tax=Oldenlandia corymbosa var. corymbosa TaxID=529605 RepID=A0AAV1CF30_OLDCO|nr:OLC1v1029549C1 [Oldenlandia corymbosa var. corymbosa]
MASSDLERRANEAFIDDHFDLAVDLYSQAIAANPNNAAEVFADRAQANIKLSNFAEAVADANKSIELDPSIAKAYLRKGIASIKLKKFQSAKEALQLGASILPQDPRFSKFITECENHISEETKKAVNSTKLAVEKAGTNSVSKPKFRHEFYQKPEEVVVTIFAKGVPTNNVRVEYGEQILSVTINKPNEEVYSFQPRLFGKIIPEKCRYDVLSTKIEIRLAKAEPIQWASLEFVNRDNLVVQRVNNNASGRQRPAYPSSRGGKDWDKLEAEVKKEEKEEKLDGDAAVNKFFRDIYKDVDEDARRAMMKSFVESNGTVLSTNWDEVGSKKVEGSAPDGMELKKWEY